MESPGSSSRLTGSRKMASQKNIVCSRTERRSNCSSSSSRTPQRRPRPAPETGQSRPRRDPQWSAPQSLRPMGCPDTSQLGVSGCGRNSPIFLCQNLNPCLCIQSCISITDYWRGKNLLPMLGAGKMIGEMVGDG